MVRGLLEDSNGNIWASTKSGMVYIYNNEMKLIHRFPFAPEKNGSGYNVYTIYQDSKGYIWMGAKNRGLGISKSPLGTTPDAYRQLEFDYIRSTGHTNALINNDIYSITEDHLGRIWVGTFSSGIDIIEHPTSRKAKTFIHINSGTSNLQGDNIRYIYRDSQNNIWVATSYGLYKLSKSSIEQNHFEFKTYLSNDNTPEISYNDIVHIFEDTQHRIWVATLGGGVNLLNKPNSPSSKFICFSQQDGLSNDEVHSITEDNFGTVWMATENGLNPFNPETQTFKQYNALNRLTNTSFSESTVIKLKNGALVFGTAHGIEYIQPKLFTTAQPLSQIKFTSLAISNKEVTATSENSPLDRAMPFTKAVVLKHNQSSFSVEFSSLNFQDKEQMQYSYFLKGFDKEWTSTGNNNMATYTNIPPGKYQLEVQANSDFIIPATLDITILAPWYQTTLAYWGYALFIIAVGLPHYKIHTPHQLVQKQPTCREKSKRAKTQILYQYFARNTHASNPDYGAARRS